MDKSGKVLAAEPGGPAATVEVVRKLVGDAEGVPSAGNVAKKDDDAKAAETADQVADSAAKIDA